MRRLVWALGFGIPTVFLGSCGGSTSESGAGASGATGSAGATGGNGGNGGTSAGSGGTSGGTAGGSGMAGSSGATGGTAGSGGTGGGSAASGGTTSSGGTTGSGATAGAAGSGGKTCDSLLHTVNDALVKAKVCCPDCKSIQCTNAVPGLCCSETVNAQPDSPEMRAYLQAFEAFQAAGCAVICTGALCVETPSRTCQPTGTCR
jgi:hypothetical protein